MADLEFSQQLIEHDARDYLRDLFSLALDTLRSTSMTALGFAASIDDYRKLELEQLVGPEDPDNPLIRHTRRRLSDKQRVQEMIARVQAAVQALRSNPELAGGSSST